MGICFTVSWAAAFLISLLAKTSDTSAKPWLYLISGVVLLLAAVYNYIEGVKKSKSPVDLLALFSLSYIGGMGVSCFKLSRLQTDWELMTWICLFLAYICFYIFYTRIAGLTKKNICRASSEVNHASMEKRLALSIYVLTAVSLLAFCIEALILGYIPLFTVGVPHAYSYFHISGVHYFTVSCVLVPALSAACVFEARKKEMGLRRKRAAAVGICTFTAFMIPILCVSRFQLIFAVMLLLITMISVTGLNLKKTMLVAGGALIVLLPFYIFLTVERAHSISYLNGIFEMKDPETPIFISQPYIYIANNYDNFNCMVRDLSEHTMGMRMLFPFWALTGLKFIIPDVISSPLFVTKTELTTLTLFYDAYYDFGAFGVAGLSALLGYVCRRAFDRIRADSNPALHLIYAQLAAYMGLSFFTTWFSNPTTWFYLALSVIIYLYSGGCFEKILKMRS